MLDLLPITVWLLIAVAMAAYFPALYVFDYVAKSPARRDITLPPEDLSWRTQRQLGRNVALLFALAAFAVFIHTPAATYLVRSDMFLPILLSAIGSFAISTVRKGYSSGIVEPLLRGANWEFDRQTQPRRFWISMSWNALLGGLCIAFGIGLFVDAPMKSLWDRCVDRQEMQTPQERIASCSELLAAEDEDDREKARFTSLRGSAHFDLGDYRSALSDYAVAVRLDPQSSYHHYNVGIAHDNLGERSEAEEHYAAALRINPENFDAYINRGLIFLDTGRFDQAVSDFTRALEIRPNNVVPVANRGIAYAWKQDRARAERDFRTARATDPSNAVAFRGDALLAWWDDDMAGVVRHLTAAIDQNSRDIWSLTRRAEAYERLGDYDKMTADLEALDRARMRIAPDSPS